MIRHRHLTLRNRRRMCRRSLLIRYNHCISRDLSLPTRKQSDTAIFVCQLLSTLYQPIQVFRYDQKLKTIYVQSGVGNEIALVIDEDGRWEFVL
jgi:hypothetical protein